jgi:HEAT repeat protein
MMLPSPLEPGFVDSRRISLNAFEVMQSGAPDLVNERLDDLIESDWMGPDGDVLIEALGHRHPVVRRHVASRLLERMSPDFSDRLIQRYWPIPHSVEMGLSVDEDCEARRAAVLALASKRISERALRALEQAFRSSDHHLRYHAFLSLYEADAPGLQRYTEDALAAAGGALLTVASQTAASRNWTDLWDQIWAGRGDLEGEDRLQVSLCLAEMIWRGHPATDLEKEALIQDFVSGLENQGAGSAICEAIGRMGGGQAMRPLKGLLHGWFVSPTLRLDAAVALTALGDSDAVRHLQKALRSRRRGVRTYALYVVGQAKLTDMVDPLVDLALRFPVDADSVVDSLTSIGGRAARVGLKRLRASASDQVLLNMIDCLLEEEVG